LRMKDSDRHHQHRNYASRHYPYNRPIRYVKYCPNGGGKYTHYSHDGRERSEHHGTTSYLGKKRQYHSEGPASANKRRCVDTLDYYADKDPHKGIQFPNGKKQPHLYQCSNPIIRQNPLTKEERFLARDAPREKYRERPAQEKTVLHWGQRKLLMSEIEFLSDYGEAGDIVLYAGAAPGTHTNFLADLFPQIKFVLVDPADFICHPIKDRIEIRKEYFTDEIAEEFSNEKYRGKILFISDIRRNALDDKMIKEDMDMQSRWYKMIKPKKTMLKFRLSWHPGKTKYLDGKIYLPVWGPQSTTETRLVPDDELEREYDHKEYEEQMFYFNTVTRVSYYPHNINADGFDNCFDCASEALILERYLCKMQRHKVIANTINDCSDKDSTNINDMNIDPEKLKLEIEAMIEKVTSQCSIKGRKLNGPVKIEKHFAEVEHATIDKLIKKNASTEEFNNQE
jgi:hypothetical protein